MANIKSAQKRVRQTAKRRLRNRYKLVSTRTVIKKIRTASSKAEALALLPKVSSMLDKLAKHNIIHKNKAANQKSKLARLVNAMN
ncbi:MAG: 30S ribosomal protein S20 [Bacteroidia bacterium]|nr:30S ribosomal protein S20 [Bacteroidia bacterium]